VSRPSADAAVAEEVAGASLQGKERDGVSLVVVRELHIVVTGLPEFAPQSTLPRVAPSPPLRRLPWCPGCFRVLVCFALV
jgi:hypothetical protein